MAKTTTIGLDQVLIGPIASDGGMSTELVAIGTTVEGTAVITKEAPSVTEIMVEESDVPEFSVSTGGGYTVGWSTYDLDPLLMQKIFGGTVTGSGDNAKWSAPLSSPSIEVSVRMISKKGFQADMPRVQLTPDFAINFQKTTPGQINISGRVLTPTKANTAPISTGKTAAFVPVG